MVRVLIILLVIDETFGVFDIRATGYLLRTTSRWVLLAFLVAASGFTDQRSIDS